MSAVPLRTVMNLLFWEASFAMAYETWVGPIYVSGLAGELGVSVGLVSLLAALPWIGASGQLLGAWAFTRVSSVRRYTLLLASAARALWVIPLILALYLGHRQRTAGEAFPVSGWFAVVASTACCSAVLASSSAAAWLSWVKGLVPHGFQGRFLGNRQRFVMGALVLANVVAASLVGWKPDGYRAGYALLCGLALSCAFLSTWFLSRIPDLAPRARPTTGFRANLMAPLRDRGFRRVLLFGAAFNGSIQLAGPFFPYYFTKELGIGMGSVALWTMLNNVGSLLVPRPREA